MLLYNVKYFTYNIPLNITQINTIFGKKFHCCQYGALYPYFLAECTLIHSTVYLETGSCLPYTH